DPVIESDKPAGGAARADGHHTGRAGLAGAAARTLRGSILASYDLALVLANQPTNVCKLARIGRRAVVAAGVDAGGRGYIATCERGRDHGERRVVADETAESDVRCRAADIARSPRVGDHRTRQRLGLRVVVDENAVLIAADEPAGKAVCADRDVAARR